MHRTRLLATAVLLALTLFASVPCQAADRTTERTGVWEQLVGRFLQWIGAGQGFSAIFAEDSSSIDPNGGRPNAAAGGAGTNGATASGDSSSYIDPDGRP
jgi:hypothetical protein